MVLNNDLSQNRYQEKKYNQYTPNKNSQYYKESPFSQSFDVEAERRNRILQQQRQRDYENPQNTDPETDYYYKESKTSSDINDYNNRYTYNFRRDFEYIDFNKLYPENNFGKKIMINKNDTNNNKIKFNKPFQGPPLFSRGRSYDSRYKTNTNSNNKSH